MAISLKDLRKKIKSIQGTKKLTQAMQMVAASKMQKAIKQAEASRDYSRLAWEIIKNIRSRTDINQHPLLVERPLGKEAFILVTSNRGLCGGLNSQIIRKIISGLKEKKEKNIEVDIITIGKKGKQFIARHFRDALVADFPLADRTIEFFDILPLTEIVLDDYIDKKYDRIAIFYNQFISTLKQESVCQQLLPIPPYEETSETLPSVMIEYKFEPDMRSVLDALLPTVIRTQIYQILLEASASEHSARMMAMKNATDNASDLIDDLSLTYNSLRQAAITREITEISAGAEALRSESI